MKVDFPVLNAYQVSNSDPRGIEKQTQLRNLWLQPSCYLAFVICVFIFEFWNLKKNMTAILLRKCHDWIKADWFENQTQEFFSKAWVRAVFLFFWLQFQLYRAGF